MTFLPDREQIATFVNTLFKHASTGSWVSLRTFYDDDRTESFRITPIQLNGDLGPLIDAAYADAARAANAQDKVVFCPPIASFTNKEKARQEDLCDGLDLAIELDHDPQASLEKLEQLLGPATVVVASGGVTAEGEPKLHGHWRGAVPARTKAEHDMLKEARILACEIVGGDGTHTPISHPIRWPGSWHRKAEPKLCKIKDHRPDVEIDLADALEKLKAVATPKQKASAKGQASSDYADLIEAALTSDSFHEPLIKLAAKVISKGFDQDEAISFLEGVMNAVPGPHDARWQSRYDDISRSVSTAMEKFGCNEVLLESSGDFAAGLITVSYLFDGFLIRGFLYAFTAATGHGKTAIALLFALLVALGRSIGPHTCDKGRAIYFVGENDIDTRMRWIKTCEDHGVDPCALNVQFMCGIKSLSDEEFQKQLLQELGNEPVALMIVDTSQAYNEADDINDNVDMLDHARALRKFTKIIPGKPTVLTLCHPVKITPTTIDQCAPKGGGSFVNEIDGNIGGIIDKDNLTVKIGTAVKFRGPTFDTLYFKLTPGTSEKIKDDKDRLMWTVSAKVMSDEEVDALDNEGGDERSRLMQIMRACPGASLAALADKMGVKRRRVQTVLETLAKAKMVTQDPVKGNYGLSEKGEKWLKELDGAAAKTVL